MYSIVINFEIDRPNEFFINFFREFVGSVLSKHFVIEKITPSKPMKKRIFKVSSIKLEDLYVAGMIGCHIQRMEEDEKIEYTS